MSLESHLDQLVRKHEALKAQIALEQRRPAADETELKTLKKRKLKLKEQIVRAQTQVA